jgi:hypothetical protein
VVSPIINHPKKNGQKKRPQTGGINHPLMVGLWHWVYHIKLMKLIISGSHTRHWDVSPHFLSADCACRAGRCLIACLTPMRTTVLPTTLAASLLLLGPQIDVVQVISSDDVMHTRIHTWLRSASPTTANRSLAMAGNRAPQPLRGDKEKGISTLLGRTTRRVVQGLECSFQSRPLDTGITDLIVLDCGIL